MNANTHALACYQTDESYLTSCCTEDIDNDDDGINYNRFDGFIPDICHGRHGRRPCKFFLAGVNFYRFNAKNWHFRQILREKVAFFFYRFNVKNWQFTL